LGGENVAGGKLKEIGTTHWNSPNDATDDYNFTALLAGVHLRDGSAFGSIGTYNYYWSSTFLNNIGGFPTYSSRDLSYDNLTFPPNDFNTDHGLSVRCIKD
jgi:uncharacterized protein (TIGR02145 family)